MNYTLIACRPTTQMQAPSQPTSANTRTCGPVDPPLLLAWDERRSAKKGGNKKRSDVEPARVSSTSSRLLSPTGALPREHEFGAWRGFWHMTCPPPDRQRICKWPLPTRRPAQATSTSLATSVDPALRPKQSRRVLY